MADDKKRIDLLLEKLETLMKKQESFQEEINRLKTEIYQLKHAETYKPSQDNRTVESEQPKIIEPEDSSVSFPQQVKQEWQEPINNSTSQKLAPTSNLEKFIGENLINKIGIAITVIGVGIGAKYAIEHQMLSPLTRIILGYLAGIALLGFAIKLKRSYENYSAVLLSGAMAIMYFITYIAFSFYNLFPQTFAFALMVFFTVFTVIAAINYNQQVIAHIGLVGAYGVPFLLSNDLGKVSILFTYMAIINIGILFISFKKYWKPLYYAAFILSWLIFFSWYITKYEIDLHFTLTLTFLIIFFLIFYLTFLIYKLSRKEKFGLDDILLLLANSFIFFGIGFAVLTKHNSGEHLLGLFTLCNAIVHFLVAVIIYKNKLADRNLFYLVAGLVLVFITIAIPVQLDGNWVTLLWAGEAALLFVIGRTQKVVAYEILSYPLMLLACISIIHDWAIFYGNYSLESPELRVTPFLNISFLSSILFIAAFTLINVINNKDKNTSALANYKFFDTVCRFMVPAILIVVAYFMFRVEIVNFFKQLYVDSGLEVKDNSDPAYPYTYLQNDSDIKHFRAIWMINFSMVFLIVLSLVNIIRLKNKSLGLINLGLNAICMGAFLILGLFLISELRESYLQQTMAAYYHRGIFHLIIRYITILIASGLVYISYIYILQPFIQFRLKKVFDLLMHLCILWVASSELIHWLDMADSAESYKLGLSILWGLYSLLLISVGIWKKRKYLRVGAICLFAVTLLKLFFYDLSHLSTIAKTIVFVSLGVLLLIISFLYNKYKHIIADETTD
jgi:uncharacterized membrane protein